jgi:hypothetical protein
MIGQIEHIVTLNEGVCEYAADALCLLSFQFGEGSIRRERE